MFCCIELSLARVVLRLVVCNQRFTRCAYSGKMGRFAAWVVKLVDTRDLKIEHRAAKVPA